MKRPGELDLRVRPRWPRRAGRRRSAASLRDGAGHRDVAHPPPRPARRRRFRDRPAASSRHLRYAPPASRPARPAPPSRPARAAARARGVQPAGAAATACAPVPAPCPDRRRHSPDAGVGVNPAPGGLVGRPDLVPAGRWVAGRRRSGPRPARPCPACSLTGRPRLKINIGRTGRVTPRRLASRSPSCHRAGDRRRCCSSPAIRASSASPRWSRSAASPWMLLFGAGSSAHSVPIRSGPHRHQLQRSRPARSPAPASSGSPPGSRSASGTPAGRSTTTSARRCCPGLHRHPRRRRA